MQQNRVLEIYPTSRALRYSIENLPPQNRLLEKKITISDFISRATIVDDRLFVDQERRTLLLREATKIENFSELGIEREFFNFLKNSQILFKFFEELAVEGVELDRLLEVDIYASYEEHITILKKVLSRYIALLDENGYVDKITMPKLYTINNEYIKGFDKIVLYLEGYLTNFEFELFSKISKLTNLEIELHTNLHNKKMLEKFKSLGFELELDRDYQLDISSSKIVSQKRASNTMGRFRLFASNDRLMQVAFVKRALYELVERGVDPKKIAVITPDSSFATLLKLMDDENNFNLAMGISFTKSEIYRELIALYEWFRDPTLANIYKLKRVGFDLESATKRTKKWGKNLDSSSMSQELESFIKGKSDQEAEIYQEELHNFKRLFPSFEDRPFIRVLHLFITRLQQRSIDDVTGGKVTVMEVLESRGVAFDGVVVVDFNEGTVPTKSKKDLFLSSGIRALASLPTPSDRENLQKYYYKRLFERAKHIYISYVEDEQNSPSRFIEELKIKQEREKPNELYHDILFQKATQREPYIPESIKLEYDFTKVELSASRLKTFLECPRKYYFRYIRGFKEATLPTDIKDEKDMGNLLHLVLKDIYTKKSFYDDGDELYIDIQRALYRQSESDMIFRYHVDIWLERLKQFAINEVERFGRGYRVEHCEKRLTCEYNGFKLVGTIDRIDRLDGRVSVIDYKSGNIPDVSLNKSVDFQLQFYHLLASTLGDVEGCYYYELKSAKLKEDSKFDQKMSLLGEKLALLKEREFDFYMTEDKTVCKYCPYNKLCMRSA